MFPNPKKREEQSPERYDFFIPKTELILNTSVLKWATVIHL